VKPKTRSIREEIKRNRPFASASHEGLIALLRTADVLRRKLAQTIEPAGITLQQYNVLRILRGAGEAGIPTLEIAARMIEQMPGITRLIDRLLEKQLVSRERCETDRRQVFCCITPAGLALLKELDAPVSAADEASLAMIPEGEVRGLIDTLDRVRAGHG
jgi:MarR family transcriptional regulator, organic hydroperoxide resistance regulator